MLLNVCTSTAVPTYPAPHITEPLGPHLGVNCSEPGRDGARPVDRRALRTFLLERLGLMRAYRLYVNSLPCSEILRLGVGEKGTVCAAPWQMTSGDAFACWVKGQVSSLSILRLQAYGPAETAAFPFSSPSTMPLVPFLAGACSTGGLSEFVGSVSR